MTQNEAHRLVGHLTFVSKHRSAVGNERISQFFHVARVPHSQVIALVNSTWVFLLLSSYIFILWKYMPLFKVWNEDKLKKKFVVAENFAELVSKGKRFCYLFISCVDGETECCMQQVIWQVKLLFLLVIVFVYI